jgi:hypothetical protein
MKIATIAGMNVPAWLGAACTLRKVFVMTNAQRLDAAQV